MAPAEGEVAFKTKAGPLIAQTKRISERSSTIQKDETPYEYGRTLSDDEIA